MKKQLLIPCLFLAISLNHFTFSQTAPYSKVINFLDSDGIQTYASCQNYEGSTLLVGETYQSHGMLISIDKDANQLWNKGFKIAQSNRHPVFHDVIATHDSCYFVLGNFSHPEGNLNQAFYCKIKNNGDTIWTGSLAISNLYKCAETLDHGFILIGYEYNVEGSQNSQIAMAKINSEGSLLWSKILKIGDFYSLGQSIEQSPNGNYLISGYYQIEAYAPHLAVLGEISPEGEAVWVKSYEDQLDERDLEANGFVLHDNFIYLLMNNEWNSIILKTDLSGNIIWSKEIASSGYWNFMNMSVRKLKKTPNNELLFISSETFSSYTKLDLDGNVLLNGYLFIVANDIHSTENDGILVTGNGPIMLVKNEWNNNIGLIQMDESGFGVECVEYASTYSEDKPVISSEISMTSLNGGTETSIIMDIYSSLDLDFSDGCVDAIGGIADKESRMQCRLFPSPNQGKFTIESEQYLAGELSIIDQLGQVILQKSINGLQSEIILDHAIPGIYFYKIETENDLQLSGKFLIQK